MKPMKKLTASLFVVLNLWFLNTAGYAGAVDITGNSSPQVFVAKVHADWCGSCRALEPIIVKLKDTFADDPVLFVTLDVTSKTTISQARLLAVVLGIEEQLKENNKTGLLLVWSSSENKLVEILTLKSTHEEMVNTIKKALG